MVTYYNPQGSVNGGPDPDTFLFDKPITSFVTSDAYEDFDKLTVDYRTATEKSFFRAGDIFGSGTFYGTVQVLPYGPALTFYQFEDLRFIGSAFDDQFEMTIRPSSSALLLNIDGGDGVDYLLFDLSKMTSAVSFVVDNGTISSSFGQFANLEKFRILTGSGNDVIHTGDLDDTVQAGVGSDEIFTGAGNDDVYTESGGDSVDMGGGYDHFGGNYGASNVALTVVIGDTITVSNGVTAINVESVTIGTGTGDDVINVTRDISGTVYGSSGLDTLNYAASLSGPQTFVFHGDTGSLYGSANSLSVNEVERVVIEGGAGDDHFEIFGPFAATSFSFDGGGGLDLLRANFTSLAGASSFIVQPDGTIVTNRGEFVSIERFQLSGGSGADIFTTQAGNDSLTGGGGNDGLEGGAGLDVLGGGDGNDQLFGGADNDTLFGDLNDDLLDGGSGADTMSGGPGNDIFVVDNAGDVVNENSGAGTDEIRVNLATYSLAARPNIENLTGTSAAGQALTGNGGNNVITGAAGNDTIDGGVGADTMIGGGGNDVYVVDSGGDSIVEIAGEGTDEVRTALASYALASELENLTGLGALGQSLTGNGGANIIDGGLGADTMTGLAGDDVYVIDNAGDVVVESVGEGTDEIRIGFASVNLADYANVENLTGTSVAGQSLTGTGSANVITGASGNDLIDGGAGADSMAGHAGNDIYVVDNGGDLVTELAGEGTDEVRTALASYALAANVENVTGLGNVDQSLTGNGLDNIIDGGSGADTMTGGLGNDLYIVDNGGDIVVELAGEGIDTIRTSALYYDLRLHPEIENLTASNNDSREFRGNGLNNVITGAGGNDFMWLVEGGVDTVIGAGGNDVFLFGATLTSADSVEGGTGTDQVVVQGDYSGGLTLGTNFVGIESFAILPGSDTRFGDPGTNFYDYDLTTVEANVAAGVTMVVDANRLRAGEDFTFNGSAETDGGFFIYGGGGTDTLLGGSGNDTFYFGQNGQFGSGDHVDGGAGGIDQLGLRGNYTIVFGANQLTSIESLGLVSAQDTRFGGLGTAYNYNLTMNDGNVAAGVRMTVDAAPLRGGETLTFDGSAELDGSFRIFGGQGGDTIKGSQGNDLITGGTGADNLWGSGGNDSFIYRNVADSTSTASDSILDFSTGADRLDLSQIDADSIAAGNQAFHWIGANAFTGGGAASAGELRAYESNGSWFVEGDVNGDGATDLLIQLTTVGGAPIGQSDFFL